MKNYFKAVLLGSVEGERREVLSWGVWAFEDTSTEDTAAAHGAALDFAETHVGATVSVWRHPACSHAWDDVRIIGEFPEKVSAPYDTSGIVVAS